MSKEIILCLLLFSYILSYRTFYKTTINDIELTFNTSFIIQDQTILDEDDVSNTNFNDVSILVVEGAHLRIKAGLNVSKTMQKAEQEKTLKKKNNPILDTNEYKYGLYGNIVAIGKKTQVTIENAIIYVDCPFASGIVALNGATISLKNTTIITKSKYSKGISVFQDGSVKIDDNSKIITYGNYSPCLEMNDNGKIEVDGLDFYTDGVGSPLMNFLEESSGFFYSGQGKARNSQISVIKGQNYIMFFNCNLTFRGRGENENRERGRKKENLDTGGFVLQNVPEKNSGKTILDIIDSKVQILKNDQNIPIFSCLDTNGEINLENSKFDQRKKGTFLRSNRSPNSKSNTRIELFVKYQPISGLIVTDRSSRVVLHVDKNLQLNIRTKGRVEIN